MYLSSKNGHFGRVLYTVSEVIEFHKKGFIVYQPIFSMGGRSLTIPTQSKTQKLYESGKLLEMEFRDGIPYWNDKPLSQSITYRVTK